MSDAAYHIIVIAVAAVAVIRGFHSGFTGQVSGVLGFAFGTVCAHVFDEQAEALMRALLPWFDGHLGCKINSYSRIFKINNIKSALSPL